MSTKEVEPSEPVDLYIYDLSNGLAAVLSPAILGKQVEGVWHTSVVVYGREYFFGGEGIVDCKPGSTQLGAPCRVVRLGQTQVPHALFTEWLSGLGASTFAPHTYSLLEHNCNTFTEETAQFLCGAHIPAEVLHQPERDLPPPLRQALAAMLENNLPREVSRDGAGGVRARRDSEEFLALNSQVDAVRQQSAELERRRRALGEKLARTQRRLERKRDKERRRATTDKCVKQINDMAEAVCEMAGAGVAEPAERKVEQRRRDLYPPILFTDIDGEMELEKLERELSKCSLSEDERRCLDELRQYVTKGEGSWILGDDFLTFIGNVLGGGIADAGTSAPVLALRVLSSCALRDDWSLVLHQDRRDHALMARAHDVDRMTNDTQLALATFMCNLFAHPASSEWLLYISEWTAPGGTTSLANIRVTTKVCVHAMVGDSAALRDVGTALLHNIASKEVKTVVFDEVCVELAAGALAVLSNALQGAGGGAGGEGDSEEEAVWRVCGALARLAAASRDVPALVAAIGPDPNAFRGTSQRVDQQIDLIMTAVK